MGVKRIRRWGNGRNKEEWGKGEKMIMDNGERGENGNRKWENGEEKRVQEKLEKARKGKRDENRIRKWNILRNKEVEKSKKGETETMQM